MKKILALAAASLICTSALADMTVGVGMPRMGYGKAGQVMEYKVHYVYNMANDTGGVQNTHVCFTMIIGSNYSPWKRLNKSYCKDFTLQPNQVINMVEDQDFTFRWDYVDLVETMGKIEINGWKHVQDQAVSAIRFH